MSAETWEQSYAIKYINYEAEPGHVNLENPLQMTEANERRVRSYKKGKNKKKGKDGEFSVTEEGITEVVGRSIGVTYNCRPYWVQRHQLYLCWLLEINTSVTVSL